MKQHFASASPGQAAYLTASLSFLAADTRQGMGDEARAAFAVIKGRSSVDPRLAGYVDKIEAGLPKAAAAARPGIAAGSGF